MAARRKTSRYNGVQRVRSGGRSGSFQAKFRVGERIVHAGVWLTEKGAALAHDRMVLFLGASRELNFPKRAKKLGPASQAELRKLARLEYRRASGRVRYEGVTRQTEGFREGAFSARVTLEGKTFALGIWPTEREAALARDRALLGFGADDVQLNLPRAAKKLGGASVAELRRLAHARHQELTGGSSPFWGVYWDSAQELWAVRVRIDGTFRHVGHFADEKQAALIRDRVEKWRNGKNARLNFPKEAGSALSLPEARRIARKPFKQGTSSRYEGVCLLASERTRPWRAELMLTVRGKQTMKYLGRWPSQRAAAQARDRAVLFYYSDVPERLRLNFPKQASTLVPADAATLLAEARAVFKATTSSRFRGVTFHPASSVWRANFVRRGKRYSSVHDDEESAARWYDVQASRHLGKRAYLNFHPVTGEELCGKRVSSPVARRTRQSASRRKA